MNVIPRRRKPEDILKEPFSAISHLIGAFLAVVALIVLLWLAHGRFWQSLSFAIYGTTLILVYIASTLYHALKVNETVVEKLRQFDHIAIFLLIAGTYTPLCLVRLRNGWGWGMLATEWGLALLGIVLTLFWKKAPEWFRISLYIIMGWLVSLAINPVRELIGAQTLAWLMAGGVVYTMGTVVFATQRPRLWPGKFGYHDLWHIFVLGGSVCHFVMMTRIAAVA